MSMSQCGKIGIVAKIAEIAKLSYFQRLLSTGIRFFSSYGLLCPGFLCITGLRGKILRLPLTIPKRVIQLRLRRLLKFCTTGVSLWEPGDCIVELDFTREQLELVRGYTWAMQNRGLSLKLLANLHPFLEGPGELSEQTALILSVATISSSSLAYLDPCSITPCESEIYSTVMKDQTISQ